MSSARPRRCARRSKSSDLLGATSIVEHVWRGISCWLRLEDRGCGGGGGGGGGGGPGGGGGGGRCSEELAKGWPRKSCFLAARDSTLRGCRLQCAPGLKLRLRCLLLRAIKCGTRSRATNLGATLDGASDINGVPTSLASELPAPSCSCSRLEEELAATSSAHADVCKSATLTAELSSPLPCTSKPQALEVAVATVAALVGAEAAEAAAATSGATVVARGRGCGRSALEAGSLSPMGGGRWRAATATLDATVVGRGRSALLTGSASPLRSA